MSSTFQKVANNSDSPIYSASSPFISNSKFKSSNDTAELNFVIYPFHYYYTVDTFLDVSDVSPTSLAFNVGREAFSDTIRYSSGVDDWNNIIYRNTYSTEDSDYKSLIFGYIEPGTRPQFSTPALFMSNNVALDSDYRLRMSISRTNNELTIQWDTGEWSATGSIGSLNNTITYHASDFIDKVIPKRLILELNSGGGSGGTSGWFTYGGGGQAGGYWCGVVDISKGYTYIYADRRAPGVYLGGNYGVQGGSIYVWRSTDTYNYFKLVISGGAGGTRNSEGGVDWGGQIEQDSLSSSWQLAFIKGAAGAGGNNYGADFSAHTVFCTNYSSGDSVGALHRNHKYLNSNSGGVPNSGGGGGASAFANGGGGHNSAILGAGGGGGDTGASSGYGGQCIVNIYY